MFKKFGDYTLDSQFAGFSNYFLINRYGELRDNY